MRPGGIVLLQVLFGAGVRRAGLLFGNFWRKGSLKVMGRFHVDLDFETLYLFQSLSRDEDLMIYIWF